MIREMMTRNTVCTRPEATLQEAASKMKDLDAGPLPVCSDGERLVGMLTDRDITIRSVAKGQNPMTAIRQKSATFSLLTASPEHKA